MPLFLLPEQRRYSQVKRSFMTGVIFILLVLFMIQPAEVQQVVIYESQAVPGSEDYAVHSMNRSVKRTEKPVYIDEYTNIQEKELYVMYYQGSDVEMLARLLYQECGGVLSDTEKACVAWTVLNRVDAYGQTISEVITSPKQFAYYESNPVTEELYELAEDVLTRWNREKNGEEDVGRILPLDYLWFSGDGKHNYFRNAYRGTYSVWDYSLTSPYES